MKAFRPFERSHVASGEKELILLATHSVCVPVLSTSRYLWMSKIRLVFEPSGLVMWERAAAEPLETNESAEAQLWIALDGRHGRFWWTYLLPGRRINWLLAPAFRMAVTASWTVFAHALIFGTGTSYVGNCFCRSISWFRNWGYTIVWFVHDSKGNTTLVSIFLRQLSPKIYELRVRWPTLADDATIPACI